MKQRVHGSTNATYRSAIRNPNILLGIDNSVPAVTSVKSFWYVIKRQFVRIYLRFDDFIVCTSLWNIKLFLFDIRSKWNYAEKSVSRVGPLY